MVLARVEVEDLSGAVEAYRVLAGETSVRRFSHGAVDLAWVGPFLLLSGPQEELVRVRRAATVLVHDIASALAAVRLSGGQVFQGPAADPNGSSVIAQHADGAIFEYVEEEIG